LHTGLKDGGFVIAYINVRAARTNLAFRPFDKNGMAQTNEKIINTVNADLFVTIASLPNGGFVATYTGIDAGFIYYHVFAYNGSTVIQETKINDSVSSTGGFPFISAFYKGNFAMAWESDLQNLGLKKAIFTNILRYTVKRPISLMPVGLKGMGRCDCIEPKILALRL
jgi:hypothetical protein